MNVTTTLQKFGLERAFHYIYKGPDNNMPKRAIIIREFIKSLALLMLFKRLG